jgi:hypothetical protein
MLFCLSAATFFTAQKPLKTPTCPHAASPLVRFKLQPLKLVDAQRLKCVLDQAAARQPAQRTAAAAAAAEEDHKSCHAGELSKSIRLQRGSQRSALQQQQQQQSKMTS